MWRALSCMRLGVFLLLSLSSLLLLGLADKVGIGICRYRQIFADKISLFREACYLLFGYKVRAIYNLLLLTPYHVSSLSPSMALLLLAPYHVSSFRVIPWFSYYLHPIMGLHFKSFQARSSGYPRLGRL